MIVLTKAQRLGNFTLPAMVVVTGLSPNEEAALCQGGDAKPLAEIPGGLVPVFWAPGGEYLIKPNGEVIVPGSGGGSTPLADNLTTNSGTSALTARQGMVLRQATEDLASTIGGKADATATATAIAARIAATEKGAANGVVPLDSVGKIAATYLPSYVDDVVEFANLAAFPATGESGKLFLAIDTNIAYRWTGTVYASTGGPPQYATQAEAIAGIENTKTMTALRVAQFLASKNFQGQIDALVTQFQQLQPGAGAITIANDYPITPEDTVLTGNVLTNDSTTSGTLVVTQFSVAGVAGAPKLPGETIAISGQGSITIAANGAYTFTPVANFNGLVSTVTYQVSNGTAEIKQGNLSITVTPVNDSPVAAGDTSSTLQDTPVTINVLANDSDVDGDTLTIIQINSTAIASGASVAITGGSVRLNADKTLTFTPTTGVTGPASWSYTVSDGQGGTAVANVSVNVVAAGGSVEAPVIHYIDALTGPTTGGQNNLGCYLTIIGKGFGQQSDLGTLTKVYIGGVEVANYRALVNAANYAKYGDQAIHVQVGPLGGAANGVALPVTVVRNGTATSNNNNTFTPCSGRMLFVSLTGNDATAVAGDITKPWRYYQTTDANGLINGGLSTVLGPGDHVVNLGGDWTDSVGHSTCLFRFRYPAQQGTALRNVHMTVYPGGILAHSPAVMTYVTPNGVKGGIMGPNSAYVGTTGEFVSVSNMRMSSSPQSASDAGPINLQYGAGQWRVVNMVLGPWASTLAAPNNAKAAGVSGHGINTEVLGCEIYGFACVGALENHGIYVDSPEGTSGPTAWKLRRLYIHDITGGNLIQFFDNLGSANGTGWRGFTGMEIDTCYLDGAGKYGINLAPSVISAKIWNTVVTRVTYAGVRCDLSYPQLAYDITVARCTFYDNDRVVSGSGNGQVLNSGGNSPVTGAKVRFIECIFAAGPNTLASSAIYANAGNTDSFYEFKRNVYRGVTQGWTTFAADTSAIFGDPQLTNPAGGDFSLGAGSVAIDAANQTLPFPIATDFAGVARPQGAAADIGAFERVSNLPYVTAAPTFAGTYRVGGTSSISTGTWGNGPITSYSYQWFTATVANGTPTDIAGATGNSYGWQIADQAKYGGCKVTPLNAVGSTTVPIYVGGAVAAHASAPVCGTQSSITGTGGIGNVLTRVASSWTPSSGADAAIITWVWTRNGSAISGSANAPTYTQVLADDSAVIGILDSGTNQWGTTTAVSSNTITVPHAAAAPYPVGLAVAFKSADGTVSRTVQEGDWACLYFAAAGNAPGNLLMSDNQSGTNTTWLTKASDNNDPTKSGWRIRKVTQSGTSTLTVNLPTTGGATYSGHFVVVRGVDPTTPEDGDPKSNPTNAVTGTVTPSATTFPKSLLLAGISNVAAWATVTGQSDTLVASATAEGRISTVQSRTLSSFGAQAPMTFTLAAGGSGTDLRAAMSVISFRGY